jgi:ribonuclease P protein component
VRLARLSGASATLRAGAAPNGLGVARVGFAIPARVGGAVVRNRLRRRLQATLRPELARLAGFDLVIVAAPAAAGLDPERLRAELLASLRGIRGIGAGIGDNGGDRPERSGTPAAR